MYLRNSFSWQNSNEQPKNPQHIGLHCNCIFMLHLSWSSWWSTQWYWWSIPICTSINSTKLQLSSKCIITHVSYTHKATHTCEKQQTKILVQSNTFPTQLYYDRLSIIYHALHKKLPMNSWYSPPKCMYIRQQRCANYIHYPHSASKHVVHKKNTLYKGMETNKEYNKPSSHENVVDS